jgi:hypothetical protein
MTLPMVVCVILLTLGQAKPKPESVPICSYKGKIYRNFERFSEGCSTCICLYGDVTCNEKRCEPCSYIGPDGSPRLAYGNTYDDGCNICGCKNGKTTFCTYKHCANRCHVTNRYGDSGWVDQGTMITDSEDGEGNPQVCNCESQSSRGLEGSLKLVCESWDDYLFRKYSTFKRLEHH